MKKTKLYNIRKSQCVNQEQMADKLAITVSTYCRKEAGIIRIRSDEWTKIAAFLNVPIDAIYESDERHLLSGTNSPNYLFNPISNPFCFHCSTLIYDANIRRLENEIFSIKSELSQIKQVQNTKTFASK